MSKTNKATAKATAANPKKGASKLNAELKFVSDFETMRPKDVVMENFDIGTFTTKSIRKAWINYINPDRNTKSPLAIQLPEIQLNYGGIRPIDDEKKEERFITSDEDREKMSFPLDPEHPNTPGIRAFFERVDEFFGSDEFAKKYFGDSPYDHAYQPCIKVDEVKPPKEGKQPRDLKKYPLIDMINMKFMMTGDKASVKKDGPKKERMLTTEVLRKNPDGTRELQEVQTITQLAGEHLRWKTKITVIFQIADIWAQSQPLQKPVKGIKFPCNYGVTCKIIKVIYVPNESRKMNIKSVGILPDEDEELGTKKPSVKNAKILVEDEDEGNEAEAGDLEEDGDVEEGEENVEEEVEEEVVEEEVDAETEETEEPEEEITPPPKPKKGANASPKKTSNKRAAVEEEETAEETKASKSKKASATKPKAKATR
jgi:hypothetical protein